MLCEVLRAGAAGGLCRSQCLKDMGEPWRRDFAQRGDGSLKRVMSPDVGRPTLPRLWGGRVPGKAPHRFRHRGARFPHTSAAGGLLRSRPPISSHGPAPLHPGSRRRWHCSAAPLARMRALTQCRRWPSPVAFPRRDTIRQISGSQWRRREQDQTAAPGWLERRAWRRLETRLG
jgi:hypothetical protein